ncbi:MAG: hypothetical protein ACJ76S_10670 [Solirubrobacteraceae bacterium]
MPASGKDPGGGDVLRSLPATRPQRRSARRSGSARSPGSAQPPAAGDRPESRATPARSSTRRAPRGSARPAPAAQASGRGPEAIRPSAATRRARVGDTGPQRASQARSPHGVELVETAIQAAGELTQIGFTLGARALRGAISRLPRP